MVNWLFKNEKALLIKRNDQQSKQRKPQEGKIFAIRISDKGLIVNVYKESFNLKNNYLKKSHEQGILKKEI